MNENTFLSPVDIIEQLKLQKIGEPFPQRAIQAAIERREEVTPLLLEALAAAAADVPAIGENDILPIYAMYLLAQFREERAFPSLVKFFSWPGEVTLDAVGDLVTEDLARILAAVCGGNSAAIEALADNDTVNEHVRSAALEALVVLVANDLKPRAEVIEYYRGLFQKWPRTESFAWMGLVLAACDLHPGELMPEIRKAFADHLIDESVLEFPEIQEAAAASLDETILQLREEITLITDVVAEMSWWHCFQPEAALEDHSDEECGGCEECDDSEALPPVDAKVGRNELCPCGSGNKFKKCCGKSV